MGRRLIVEPSTILVIVLIMGVVALLVWFETNSRRNEARLKRELELSHQAERDGEAMTQTDNNETKAA